MAIMYSVLEWVARAKSLRGILLDLPTFFPKHCYYLAINRLCSVLLLLYTVLDYSLPVWQNKSMSVMIFRSDEVKGYAGLPPQVEPNAVGFATASVRPTGD